MLISSILDSAIRVLKVEKLAEKLLLSRFFDAISLYQSGDRQKRQTNPVSHSEMRFSYCLGAIASFRPFQIA